ncbi:response regulator [Nocardia mikamii]|uniref:response regulator n=1 Tax=Nocardia mikamii TaxID=508464 RepID=UPI0007A51B80|nr:response regulator [Nocardia mikamii]
MSGRGAPIIVLLVEDDPADELITREAFEHNGIDSDVRVVRDGREALDFLYRRDIHHSAPRPDLILLDVNLPREQGKQVLGTIKADPGLAVIPVVALTTGTVEEEMLDWYRHRADTCVSRSAHLDQFVSAIGRLGEFYFGAAGPLRPSP